MDIIIDFDMEINELLIKLDQLKQARENVIYVHNFVPDTKDRLVENLTKEIDGIERDIELIMGSNTHDV